MVTDEAILGGPGIIVQPASGFAGDNGFELEAGFSAQTGYTPAGSTIKNLEIRGFPASGICIHSDGNTVQGNTIHGNGDDGVCVEDGNNNMIGGPNAADGNDIFENGHKGVHIRQVSASLPPVNNAILGNRIRMNGTIGIDLGGDSFTQNLYPAGPTKPLVRPATPNAVNFGVNYPLLHFVSVPNNGDNSTVEGSLLTWPNAAFRVQVFLVDASGKSNGEGAEFLGETEVTTDARGYAPFTFALSKHLEIGQLITATATDLSFGKYQYVRVLREPAGRHQDEVLRRTREQGGALRRQPDLRRHPAPLA